MFTAMDKAIAALLGAIVYMLGHAGISLPWVTPELLQDIAVYITPLVVWAVPNKTAPA